MSIDAREHVPALASLLTLAALALVFSAALGAVGRAAIPRAPGWFVAAVPHVNAAVSLVAIGVIASGWRWIRRGRVRRHRRAMIAGVVLFFSFLALYLYRVALEGPTPFGGPRVVYQFVYLPVLVVHVSLAVVCVPLLFYVLGLGLTHDPGELYGTLHPRIGRVAVVLWLTSFALGIVVYLLLYVVAWPA